MPPRKRSRCEFAAPPLPKATQGCPLPADLLLETVARSDAATLVRCAATCRSLRRDIRRPAFIRRVCNDGPDAIVPPRVLGFLDLDLRLLRLAYNPPSPSFSLAHPATPAAASLSATRLAPSLRRRCVADADRLARYEALTSRDGLVLLRRSYWTGTSEEMMMCVYDPMAGGKTGTFFPGRPDATRVQNFGHNCEYDKYVLLTPADGVVGCSFLVLFADFSGLHDGKRAVRVRTFYSSKKMVRTFSPSPDLDAWSPTTFASNPRQPWYNTREPHDSVAVLRGGLVHWLVSEVREQCYIFTYDVITAAPGCIELPAEVPADCRGYRMLHLTSSPCGRHLSLLAADKFKVSVWFLLSGGDDDNGACSWARHAVIDTTLTVCYPVLKRGHLYYRTRVDIVGSGARSGAVMLLPSNSRSEFDTEAEEGLIVLDLETKEMRAVNKKRQAFVYEVDMASRLSAMINF